MQPAPTSHDTKRQAGPWAGLLQRAWLGRGPLACALWPLSQLHGLLVALRLALYRAGLRRSTHPGVPVVVVGNLVAGGTGVAQELSARDRQIAEALGPVLYQRGLMLVGLDVIGDHLTEINVTSPTCMVEIRQQSGFDAAGAFITAIEHACGLA